MPAPIIGVLGLQGDFREHLAALGRIGVQNKLVRTPAELATVQGLVIPGGESTVMHKLSVAYGMFHPIRDLIRSGFPVFGTCAGLIMLSDEILDGTSDQETFGGLDVVVRRNAFGHQRDSFEVDLPFAGIEGPPIHAAFIRAPIVEKVGPKATAVAELPDGRVVGVRQENLLGISFHPEVTGEDRIHGYFANLVEQAQG